MPLRASGLLAVFTGVAMASIAAAAELPKIASINVCTDQLLTAVADKE